MEIKTLSNGLTIIYEPIGFFRSVSFGIWVRCGSKNETARENGASHFIEHMLFNGTDTLSAMDIAVKTDLFGGQVNAYTTKEYTCFYAHTLNTHAPQAFEMLCEMITNPRLDEADLDTERGVILDEIAMYEDSADDLAMDLLYGASFAGNPLSRPILGTNEAVEAFTPACLRAFKDTHYTPEHTVISVCGSFDKDAFEGLIQQYFAEMPRGEKRPPETAPVWRQGISRKNKDFEQTAVLLGWPGFPVSDDRRFALSLFSNIAGSNASSRLFQRLREELGLVYSVYSYHVSHKNTGLFGVSLLVTPDCEEKALSEALAVLREIKSTITEEELLRNKEQLKSGLVLNGEVISARSGNNARGILMEGRIRSDDEYLSLIERITLGEVIAAAEHVLDFDALSFTAVGRVKEEQVYRRIIDAQ